MIMITKELQKAYKAPVAKVVEVGVYSVLCQSDETARLGGSYTEHLDETDLSESIW